MKQTHLTLLIIFAITAALMALMWSLIPAHFLSGADRAEDAYKQAGWQSADTCFQLDVANTQELRRLGLSDHEGLAANEGMLFLYDTPGEYGFWMRNMSFPIDIIWLTQEDEIVSIESNVSPDSYPETFYPAKKASKVIEVPAGTAGDLDLEMGDKLNLSSPTTTTPVDCAML